MTALWEEAVGGSRPYPAYLVERDGGWSSVGWEAAGAAVDEIAAGLLSLGIAHGDRVALLGRTRLEWTLCDFALASIGAVSVPIYPTSSTLECAYILGNAGARALICEAEEHAAIVAPLRTQLEALDCVVAMEEGIAGTIALSELRDRGRAHAADVAHARAAVAEDDLLTIIYTSGTTGPPKGCLLSQRHFWVMVDMIRNVPGLFAGHDRILLYLPLAHNFARLVEYAGVGAGFTIGFCPDTADLPRALAAVRPTIFPSVPRVFEKVEAAVSAAFAEATGPRRALVEWALAIGRRRSAAERAGRPTSAGLRAQAALADGLVFSKVKRRFGGSLRIAISGGAPLSPEIAELFHALDILILEGYGLTECTTASHLNRPDHYRFGTVGLPLPGVEALVADDGEVLLRGENVFAGYHADDRATREAFTDDGWLRTGDVGSIDADGFLTITDRKKDLIITAGAKNVSPQNIENALKRSGVVSNALVVGDRRPYIVALITVDPDGAGQDDATRAAVERAVAAVNDTLARPEQIKRYAILPRDFLAEEGEVTPTLKLRRHVCEEHFRTEIEALYGP